MPRYFFHVIDGEEIIDTEGTKLAGLEEARAEAVVVSGAMLKEAGRKFWNNGDSRLRVADEAGETVCGLRFQCRARLTVAKPC